MRQEKEEESSQALDTALKKGKDRQISVANNRTDKYRQKNKWTTSENKRKRKDWQILGSLERQNQLNGRFSFFIHYHLEWSSGWD